MTKHKSEGVYGQPEITKSEYRELLKNGAKLLGRKGGQSKSESKVQAARDNGKKGGRPIGKAKGPG